MKVGFGSFLDEEVARPAKEETFWSTGQAGVEGWMDQLATPLVGGDKRLPPPEADFHSQEDDMATPVTFLRPCLWCRMNRPDQPPNLVRVLVEKSDGICTACASVARQQIAARKAAR